MSPYLIGQAKWLSVLGGATRHTESQVLAAYRVGRELARCGRNLLTGGTTGIPYAAALGAKEAGALVVGISPAASLEEHVSRYRKPVDAVDLLVYTGMSVEGRSPLIIRSVAGMFFLGGEFGTLNEFSAAWLCGGKVLGILEGLSGITDRFRGLIEQVETNWGNTVLFGTDPERLVREVCERVDERHPWPPASVGEGETGSDVREILRRFLEGEKAKA